MIRQPLLGFAALAMTALSFAGTIVVMTAPVAAAQVSAVSGDVA